MAKYKVGDVLLYGLTRYVILEVTDYRYKIKWLHTGTVDLYRQGSVDKDKLCPIYNSKVGKVLRSYNE